MIWMGGFFLVRWGKLGDVFLVGSFERRELEFCECDNMMYLNRRWLERVLQ